MEYWEVTKARAIQTLPVWQQHTPALTIGIANSTALDALINTFESFVQARVTAQDDFDAAFRAAQTALATMRLLGVKVPQMIDGQLSENESIMKDLKDVFRNQPRDESSILKRLRDLLPVWVRANAALAVLPGGMAPIIRSVAGTAYTAALATTLLNSYTALIQTVSDKQELLDTAHSNLRAHDYDCDQLNKRYYKVAKAMADPGTPLAEALEGITTEPSTPAPETYEIDTITQGGEGGLQALVAYVPGGGDHATEKWVWWKIEGLSTEFTQVPLDPSGNALGPFTVGQVVKIYTEVVNSVGSRTTAIRTITIGAPIV